MQFTQHTLPLLTLFEACELWRRVPGWSRILSLLFPANCIDWNVLFHGAYEPDDLRMLARHAKPERPSR